jgi:hypothetical protein
MPGITKVALEILVGLVLLWVVSELLFLDIFGFRRYATRRNFPAVAKRMGLAADAHWSWHISPEYSGTFEGHQVSIDHTSASVEIALPTIQGLSLNTFGDRKTFDTGNSLLDRFFSERMGPECLKQALNENAELVQTMERVIRKWRFKMKVMDIESQYVRCKMKYGNGRYVPASVAEPLTRDLIAIAEQLQVACTDAMPAH